jgi:hypothetical protein
MDRRGAVAPREMHQDWFTPMILCRFVPISGVAVLTESGVSCYIYKVPRVQFGLPVVSCNVFVPENFVLIGLGMPR